MNLPERPIVPLLSYSDPRTPKGAKERRVEIGDEYHHAVWGLWQYTDASGIPHVAEARVLFGLWYNFCGGGRFFSPQVLMRHNNEPGWGGDPSYAWPGGFGGYTFSGQQPTFGEHFKSAKRFIPSLNDVLNEKAVEHDRAEQIMWDSLAHATLGHTNRSGKRFWVGADRADGRLTQLVNTMKERATLPGYMSPIYVPTHPHSDILTKKYFLQHASVSRGITVYPHETTIAKGTNWNSGSACRIFTITHGYKGGQSAKYFYSDETNLRRFMAQNDIDDCPKCNATFGMGVTDDKRLVCERCGHEIVIPKSPPGTKKNPDDIAFFHETLEYAISKMASPTYLDHIPYATWGN